MGLGNRVKGLVRGVEWVLGEEVGCSFVGYKVFLEWGGVLGLEGVIWGKDLFLE